MEWPQLDGIGFATVCIVIVALTVFSAFRKIRRSRGNAERSEALFRSMFPDLQPYFHPLKLIAYVRARSAYRPAPSGKDWQRPAGFETDRAQIRFVDGRERVRLLDAAGSVLGEFLFEEHAEGGVLRVGKGKFTVNIRDTPRVRYWHPEREFKWKGGEWTFQSRLADQAIDSGDHDTRFSSDSPVSGAARGAAIAGGIVAAGGAFDGGGASQGWADSSGDQGSDSPSPGSDDTAAAASGTAY